jgi:ABC-type cobalamin transport system permease subunit
VSVFFWEFFWAVDVVGIVGVVGVAGAVGSVGIVVPSQSCRIAVHNPKRGVIERSDKSNLKKKESKKN